MHTYVYTCVTVEYIHNNCVHVATCVATSCYISTYPCMSVYVPMWDVHPSKKLQ